MHSCTFPRPQAEAFPTSPIRFASFRGKENSQEAIYPQCSDCNRDAPRRVVRVRTRVVRSTKRSMHGLKWKTPSADTPPVAWPCLEAPPESAARKHPDDPGRSSASSTGGKSRDRGRSHRSVRSSCPSASRMNRRSPRANTHPAGNATRHPGRSIYWPGCVHHPRYEAHRQSDSI